MNPRSPLLIVGTLTMLMLSANAQELPAASEARDADKRLTVVFDAERPSKTDILLLRNGDKLTGTVLNKTLAIRTSYASLSFNNRMIAGIDLEGGANNIEAIVTVNNNRFSGFIDDPVFVFKLQSGTQIEVRREKVLKAIFRVREAERQGIPQRQFVILKNGDYFSGKLLTDKLSIATTYAKIPVSLNEAESITFIGAQTPLTKVLMRNQDTVQGVLETEDIEIDLDVGPTVGIYKDRIEVIYTTEGFVPSDLATGISSAGPIPVGKQSIEHRGDKTHYVFVSPVKGINVQWRYSKGGSGWESFKAKASYDSATSKYVSPPWSTGSPGYTIRATLQHGGKTHTLKWNSD